MIQASGESRRGSGSAKAMEGKVAFQCKRFSDVGYAKHALTRRGLVDVGRYNIV